MQDETEARGAAVRIGALLLKTYSVVFDLCEEWFINALFLFTEPLFALRLAEICR